MHKAVQTATEGKRGCGYRKVGGIYIRSNSQGRDCGRLPIPCAVCPCCGHGIKPARGWTWVDADRFIEDAPPCKLEGKAECKTCPINQMLENGIGKAGLLWIGEGHYPTVHDFVAEAKKMGVSRRISSVPKGFVLGETYVMLAHRRAILDAAPKFGEEVKHTPGIFEIFKPERLEIVVSGDEPDEVIDGYVKRGLVPVVVERLEDQAALSEED